MRLLLIAGFLGSGKTTLIRQLAEYLVRREGKRVVIIENEIGEVGIDDKLLSMDGFEVRELFAGCVCCQLTGDLTLLVNRLGAETHPDWVIIEATGVAKPAPVIEAFREYGSGLDSISTVTLVDAGRWRELTAIIPGLIHSQVAGGDRVVVNKVDEIGEAELDTVLAEITVQNPRAPLYAVSALCRLEEPLLKGLVAGV